MNKEEYENFKIRLGKAIKEVLIVDVVVGTFDDSLIIYYLKENILMGYQVNYTFNDNRIVIDPKSVKKYPPDPPSFISDVNCDIHPK
jgi:hypothetical protein